MQSNSFLALVLRKELDERVAAAGLDPERADVVRYLDRVEEVTADQQAKRFVLRTDAPGCAASVFKAVGVALQPLVHHLPAATPPPRPDERRKTRGRPNVVPGAIEFPELPFPIRSFAIRGV